MLSVILLSARKILLRLSLLIIIFLGRMVIFGDTFEGLMFLFFAISGIVFWVVGLLVVGMLFWIRGGMYRDGK